MGGLGACPPGLKKLNSDNFECCLDVMPEWNSKVPEKWGWGAVCPPPDLRTYGNNYGTFSIAYPISRILYTHLSFDVIGSDWTGMRTKEKIELVGGHFLKFC